MLTEVKAYSSWRSAPTLLLDENGRPETDFLQVRNIDGLDPVKATINTSPRAYVDGVSFTGSDVPARNIVLTLHPNPDYLLWTYEKLRRLIYQYFMPKLVIRLVFEDDKYGPVEIFGYVEDVQQNMFSKDPEYQVSIICPDPYFTAVDPTVVTGQSIRAGGVATVVPYNGNIVTGVNLELLYTSGANPTSIGIQLGDPDLNYFNVVAGVSSTLNFEMSSVQGAKFVQNIDLSSGVINNLLNSVQDGSSWLALEPGDNQFSVVTDQGVQDWTLTFYERYGGL